MKCITKIIFIILILNYSNVDAQSKLLTPFSNTNIMGCSCYILEKNKYFDGNKYLAVVDFSGQWQDRLIEIKLGKEKIQLRIDNTSSKSDNFGIKKYFEVYKNEIYKIEIRIDYNKTKSVGDETDLYNIILTTNYKGKIEKIITKGFCGC